MMSAILVALTLLVATASARNIAVFSDVTTGRVSAIFDQIHFDHDIGANATSGLALAATARYKKDENKSSAGWNELWISTSDRVPDEKAMYAAGFAEGALTYARPKIL